MKEFQVGISSIELEVDSSLKFVPEKKLTLYFFSRLMVKGAVGILLSRLYRMFGKSAR